jgi:prepilin-type N-terminal cleavage/methylation domain-containing protein
MKKILRNKKGFTLIELLVVIAIIAILVGVGTARYMTAEKGARDTARKSDLNQYRIALENYASSNNSLYPGATNGEVTNLCNTGSPSFKDTYLSGVCLDDSLSSSGYHYYYYRDAAFTNYVLSARLEKTGTYYYVCSTGKTGIAASAPSTCP